MALGYIMPNKNHREVRVLIAIIAAISAIAVSYIKIFSKDTPEKHTTFQARDINRSSIIIGDRNGDNK